ncbi:MAG TPA: alpha-ketoglutarate-dependent dioxygenase AlkB, partial [Flavobacterium sp.]
MTEAPNLLPYDGSLNYFSQILTEAQCEHYFQRLLTSIQWKNDEAKIFGRHIITKRKAAWYGDQGFNYAYSGTTKTALPWTTELLELKAIVDKISSVDFNSCLLN